MPSSTTTRVGCIVVAAGSGSRLGADVPKAFVDLGGRPLMVHAVDRVVASTVVGVVVVVVPAAWVREAKQLLDDASGARPASGQPPVTVTVAEGGAERQDSVAAGLAALPDEVEVVLVHDAARCLAPPSLVARVVGAVRAGHAAVVPGLPVADTIKRVRPTSGLGDPEPVADTVDRGALRIAQTPQGFDRGTLAAAHAAARAEPSARFTDDAEMAELVSPVVVVPGDPLAFKITTSPDLAYAEWVLRDA
jgi:2-C-methyl-D-erythritol 4-phosphate cytidylyltransferase